MALNSSTESVDPRLKEGITLFNQGDYYACHDVLEAIWMEANTTDKPFYQGILQIAVGLYHLSNHNWQGASILLGEGVNRLRPFEPAYEGVNVERLVDCGWAWLTTLHQTGREQVIAVAAAIASAPAPLPSASSSTISLTVNGERLILPTPHIYNADP
ncbi:DUF309 domain-containing protein [Nodosilinea sp. E11]|uniref:DUF309 domain-containing protein n=1 Tax=Nodosilinea sp. E11 TaxID=3037479 RepID=UPI002934147E|nr:DUF309 domain-containing protein [Nodosilinea sp. E11]WOD40454.1 DUF309 domain-containing protein [Nodosilinea sp. E11]